MNTGVPQPARRQTSDQILARLTRLFPKVIDLSLDRLQRLLDALGNPERQLAPVVHVAGTNGKGSVVAYLRAMFEADGRRVHTYTSPHLVRFHERIRLATGPGESELVSEEALTKLLAECEKVNGDAPITYFEITTAAALLAFSRAPADAVLLEVGLGGRYDATNVVDRPRVTVITPVSMDHQSFLGDSLTKIAYEKAGILKPGVPAVIAPQADEALEAIEFEAGRVEAPLARFGQEFTGFDEHGRLVFQDTTGLLDLPLPRLRGRHQIANATTAIAAARAFAPIPESAIAKGLETAEWSARMQRLAGGHASEIAPDAEIWLDGGHNPAAGKALAETVADLEERSPRPLILIAGMMNSKDSTGFFTPFAGLAHHVLTVPISGQENARSAAEVTELARDADLSAEPCDSVDAALLRALEIVELPRILICGSLYLAGEVLAAGG